MPTCTQSGSFSAASARALASALLMGDHLPSMVAIVPLDVPWAILVATLWFMPKVTSVNAATDS